MNYRVRRRSKEIPLEGSMLNKLHDRKLIAIEDICKSSMIYLIWFLENNNYKWYIIKIKEKTFQNWMKI